jgi:hypothetical protein
MSSTRAKKSTIASTCIKSNLHDQQLMDIW